MSEFSNSNYENNDQKYSYQNTDGYSPAPQPSRSPKKKGAFGKTVRRIGLITLSAVLFGGVASGTFLTINHFAGYSPANYSTQAGAWADGSAAGEAGDSTASGTLADGSAAGAAGLDGAATGSAAGENGGAENGSALQTTAISGDSVIRGSLDVSDIAESVMPSIVSITNKTVQEVQNYFRMFGHSYSAPSQSIETESCGSGIVIGKNDTELLIVTNNHVVEGATTLSASFIDSQTYEAVTKGTDPDNDLAVIAIPLESISEDTMSQIKIAAIGNSDALKVGQQVVAIGNALGYGQSVTTGIVSATDRTIGTSSSGASDEAEEVPSYIQTDAAINPGNSGGALVNMNGEVIGINSAKLASTEVEGMGYAIPVTRVSDIIETLMNETTRTKVADSQKSSIGISGFTVDDNATQNYGIPAGVYIAEVTEGSAAEKAGLIKGEVICAFDGKEVESIEELKDILQYYAAGETIEITVRVPGSGEYTTKTVTITLDQAASAAAEETESEQETLPNYGKYR